MPLTVYVVYDPLTENVCSVHRKEDNAIQKAVELDKKGGRKVQYLHEVFDFELEE